MGDQGGFEAFYASTRMRTTHQMYALLGDMSEALDVTQDAYCKAWTHWHTVEGMADPQKWVRTVAWRLGLNRVRHIRVAARRLLLQQTPRSLPEPGIENAALIGGLRRIPADQRQAIVLHYLVDLSIEDVAEEVGVSVSAVKSRLARGRAALLPLLEDDFVEDRNA